ncbi:MAG: hypothetical protein J0H74_36315 [Chitinophagaceae bacterium]|nr:hypothetical protein [Chitinophagaceae bacterium]
MITITELNDINSTLRTYQGGRAKIWAFKLTLNRIFLQVNLSTQENIVYIVAASCEHINGPFSWNNVDISVIIEKDKETSETISYAIDKKSGFELIASGGIILAQGSEREFVEYFEQIG